MRLNGYGEPFLKLLTKFKVSKCLKPQRDRRGTAFADLDQMATSWKCLRRTTKCQWLPLRLSQGRGKRIQGIGGGDEDAITPLTVRSPSRVRHQSDRVRGPQSLISSAGLDKSES